MRANSYFLFHFAVIYELFQTGKGRQVVKHYPKLMLDPKTIGFWYKKALTYVKYFQHTYFLKKQVIRKLKVQIHARVNVTCTYTHEQMHVPKHAFTQSHAHAITDEHIRHTRTRTHTNTNTDAQRLPLDTHAHLKNVLRLPKLAVIKDFWSYETLNLRRLVKLWACFVRHFLKKNMYRLSEA